MGKSEQRELANCMTVLSVQVLKWQMQPGRRGASWQRTIHNQRRGIAWRLDEIQSLRPRRAAPEWRAAILDDATAQAAEEAGLSDFPETCPWAPREVSDQERFPD